MAKKPEMKMEAKTLFIPSQEVMTGFCYAYAKLLLNKLKELDAQDRIFPLGEEEAQEYDDSRMIEPTIIADCVIECLVDQIRYNPSYAYLKSAKGVKELIASAEEFLAIFEA